MKRKLVLYSEQVVPMTSSTDRQLRSLSGTDRPRFGYIPSQGDRDRYFFNDRKQYYAQYGIDLAVYFDLDDEYNPELLGSLVSCHAIHLSGGNTFYFLHRLRSRNMIDVLRDYVEAGGILVGVSAGAILMTPDISTSLFCNDEPVDGLTDYHGLGLVDFAFVPHWNSIGKDVSELIAYSQENDGMRVYGCPDGSSIVVEDNHVQVVGEVVTVVEGQLVS